MNRKMLVIFACVFFLNTSVAFAFPSVYPTGTTIYYPEKCWNGLTVLASGALIDMNGNVVKEWDGMSGSPIPAKILPGGYILGGGETLKGGFQDRVSVVQKDWDGNVVWEFKNLVEWSDGAWAARAHHDFQREGNPVGYFVPGMEPKVNSGKTLILGHADTTNPEISKQKIIDDIIYEVAWDGEILWQWTGSEHFDEMGFNDAEINAIANSRGASIDLLHINSVSYIGPNKWYDAGDQRFHPENIIWDSRHANIIAIIDRNTGKIVWQIGPRYDASPQLKKLGWIIGQHHAHIIPRGLPGEGNILVYDNGGGAGYGQPDPVEGHWAVTREYSRVLEFDPTTLEKIWEYSPQSAGWGFNQTTRFFSANISSAQRLPNGNTLITEGAMGRIFEVTPDYEIVWEYVSPDFMQGAAMPGQPQPTQQSNDIYRAYRVPYEWAPQLTKPVETAVIPPHNKDFRVKGSGSGYTGFVK
mgnify:CR=1 FL=1